MDRTKREAYYDNLKFWLITIVVIGHFVEFYMNENAVCRWLWYYIYIFHMPLFIFVTALFLKSTINRKPFRIDKILSYLIVCYFMKVTILLLKQYWFGVEQEFSIFDGEGPWWFLFVIAAYIPITYLLRDVKKTYVFFGSIIAALIIGFDDTVFTYMTLSRLVVGYPFFYAGYCLDRQAIKSVCKGSGKLKRISAVLFLLASALTLALNIDIYPKIAGLSTMRNPYAYLGIDEAYGAVARLLFYVLVFLMMLAIMIIIPEKRAFYTNWGSRTLQIYVVHGYIIRILAFYGFGYWLANWSGRYWPLLLILSAVLCTVLLSGKWMEKPFKKVMSLNFDFIYNQGEAEDGKTK